MVVGCTMYLFCRQSSGSLRDSGSLHKQSGRGHLNTGQAYRKEQSLSQEDGFTVKGKGVYSGKSILI